MIITRNINDKQAAAVRTACSSICLTKQRARIMCVAYHIVYTYIQMMYVLAGTITQQLCALVNTRARWGDSQRCIYRYHTAAAVPPYHRTLAQQNVGCKSQELCPCGATCYLVLLLLVHACCSTTAVGITCTRVAPRYIPHHLYMYERQHHTKHMHNIIQQQGTSWRGRAYVFALTKKFSRGLPCFR